MTRYEVSVVQIQTDVLLAVCRWFQRSGSGSELPAGLRSSRQGRGGVSEPQAALDLHGELYDDHRRRHRPRRSGASHHHQRRVTRAQTLHDLLKTTGDALRRAHLLVLLESSPV